MQGLALGIGPMFVAGMVLGYFGGAYLDRRLGSAPWGVAGGLGLGALVGFREVWRIVRRLEALDESSRKELARRRREALGEALDEAGSARERLCALGDGAEASGDGAEASGDGAEASGDGAEASGDGSEGAGDRAGG